MSFGPQNPAEQEVFAIERFRVDVQGLIQQRMDERGINQKQLAELLKVSPARISQIFSSQCNVTIKFIARVFYALDAECELTCGEPLSSRRGSWPPRDKSAEWKPTKVDDAHVTDCTEAA